MTHEKLANQEHPDGPEHDLSLPDAQEISGDLSPDESDLPELKEDL